MGGHHVQRTAAQLSNVIPPVPQLYERLWRVRSLSLLSGRTFPTSEELDELVTALDPRVGSVLLDVACSEGLYARALARRGATVVAVDHSVAFLKRVVRRATRDGLSIVAVRALAQHLPFAEQSFAGVGMGGSLNEIGDQQRAVAEMARVVRVGGSVFSMHLETATTPFGKVLQKAAGVAGVTFPTPDQTTNLFGSAPLKIVNIARDRIVVRVTAGRSAPKPVRRSPRTPPSRCGLDLSPPVLPTHEVRFPLDRPEARPVPVVPHQSMKVADHPSCPRTE